MNPVYIARRFLLFVLSVFVGVTLVFLLTRLAPGDPIEAAALALAAQEGNTGGDISARVEHYRKKFDLDGPLHVQYATYLWKLAQGDWGQSLTSYPDTVMNKISAAFPYSIGLLTVTTVLAMLFGTLVGAIIGWRKSVRSVQALLPVLMVTAAVPFFLFGIVLQYYLGVNFLGLKNYFKENYPDFELPVLPTLGPYDPGFIPGWDIDTLWQVTSHASLPAASIIIASTGLWGLGMRAMMVTTRGEDYMVLGDAKGLSERRLFFGYAVRNVLLPQTTAFALALASVVSGQVLVEVVFNYPGLGLLLRTAIGGSDYFVIQGIALIVIIAIALALFIMDLIYPLIDPRISYESS